MKMFRFISLAILSGAFATVCHASPVPRTNDKLPNLEYQPFATQPTAKYKSKAEVAAYYYNGELQEGVNAVSAQRVSKGDICITPSVTLNPKLNFPQVTVDWSASTGSGLLAYVRASRPKCKNGIEVLTYALSGGVPVLSDDVAFYLFVY
jgi:hypothetical protein